MKDFDKVVELVRDRLCSTCPMKENCFDENLCCGDFYASLFELEHGDKKDE